MALLMKSLRNPSNMAFFTKKKENIITNVVTQEVEGAEVWVVTWQRRYDNYSTSIETAGKAFLSEQDAKTFADSLREAKKLLQDSDDIHITIEKQK